MVLEFPQNFLVISPPKLMQELPIDFYSSGAFWVLPHFFKCYYLQIHLLSYVRAKNKKVSLTNNDHCLHKLSAITRDLLQRKITPLHQVFRGSCPTASHLCQFLLIFPSSKMDTARLHSRVNVQEVIESWLSGFAFALIDAPHVTKYVAVNPLDLGTKHVT